MILSLPQKATEGRVPILHHEIGKLLDFNTMAYSIADIKYLVYCSTLPSSSLPPDKVGSRPGGTAEGASGRGGTAGRGAKGDNFSVQQDAIECSGTCEHSTRGTRDTEGESK